MTDEAEAVDTSDEVSEVEATEEVVTEETQEGEAATPEQDEPKRKKGGVQKRIDELTREKYELAAKLEAQERLLRERQEALTQREHADTRPTLEQFGYDEAAYSNALQEWMTAGYQRQQEAYQQQQRLVQQQAAQMQFERDMQTKLAKAQEKYPDFNEAINSPGLPQLGSVNPAAFQAIVNSDSMADVAMHLARNPDAAHKLAGLDPVNAIKEVARLEVMLSRPAPNPKPQPPSKVVGRNDVGVSPEEMTPDEYRQWRQANRKR